MRTFLLLAVGILACCSSDGDPGGGAGPSPDVEPPEDCASPALEVAVDGTQQPVGDVSATSVLLGTTVAEAIEVGVAHHSLTFRFDDPTTLDDRIALPDARVSIDLQRQTNGGEGPDVAVSTTQPTAANWRQATATGSLGFAAIGGAVGDQRCAAFDLELTWSDASGEHAVRAAGRFAGPVLERLND